MKFLKLLLFREFCGFRPDTNGLGLSHSTHIKQHREGALVPWPVNMTESTIEAPGCP